MHITPVQAKKYQSWLAVGIFVQSFVAMLGSLYYSTFGDPVVNWAAGSLWPADTGFTPCELCWFARILMYPLVAISYVAIAKQDRRFTDYVLPLSLTGIVLETYHYALQKLPIYNIFGCSLKNPCNAMEVNYFGFITIPLLCLIAFVVITTLAVANMYCNRIIDSSTKKSD